MGIGASSQHDFVFADPTLQESKEDFTVTKPEQIETAESLRERLIKKIQRKHAKNSQASKDEILMQLAVKSQQAGRYREAIFYYESARPIQKYELACCYLAMFAQEQNPRYLQTAVSLLETLLNIKKYKSDPSNFRLRMEHELSLLWEYTMVVWRMFLGFFEVIGSGGTARPNVFTVDECPHGSEVENGCHTCIKATVELARCYLYGEGALSRKNLAIWILEKAQTKRFPDAILELAVCQLHGVGREKNTKEAVKVFERYRYPVNARAQVFEFNLRAQYLYGNCLAWGIGKHDVVRGNEFMQLALAAGYFPRTLGSCDDFSEKDKLVKFNVFAEWSYLSAAQSKLQPLSKTESQDLFGSPQSSNTPPKTSEKAAAVKAKTRFTAGIRANCGMAISSLSYVLLQPVKFTGKAATAGGQLLKFTGRMMAAGWHKMVGSCCAKAKNKTNPDDYLKFLDTQEELRLTQKEKRVQEEAEAAVRTAEAEELANKTRAKVRERLRVKPAAQSNSACATLAAKSLTATPISTKPMQTPETKEPSSQVATTQTDNWTVVISSKKMRQKKKTAGEVVNAVVTHSPVIMVDAACQTDLAITKWGKDRRALSSDSANSTSSAPTNLQTLRFS